MPLTEEQDAYGHMLLDLAAGIPAVEIIERDDGYVLPGALAAEYLLPYDRWPSHQRAVVDRARGRVLDIGCGAGRFCLELQDRGHEVVGIDVSPGAVEACRRRGVTDARPMALEEIDASLGTFDTVIMMGNNFGLFGDPAGLRAGLGRLAAVTASDALPLRGGRRSLRDDGSAPSPLSPGQPRCRPAWRRAAHPHPLQDLGEPVVRAPARFAPGARDAPRRHGLAPPRLDTRGGGPRAGGRPREGRPMKKTSVPHRSAAHRPTTPRILRRSPSPPSRSPSRSPAPSQPRSAAPTCRPRTGSRPSSGSTSSALRSRSPTTCVPGSTWA